jgi:hypothetical protein
MVLAPVLSFSPQARFKLIAQAMNRLCIRWVNGFVTPTRQAFKAVELTPCALDIGESFLNGHVFEVRQEDAQGLIGWPGCHKTFTFQEAGCMVQGKGRKAKRFAHAKGVHRPGQGRPKLCLGETYADHFFSPQGCIVHPSLLPISRVGSAHPSN